MESCGVEYKTYEGPRECIRPFGHKGGHSAFTVVPAETDPPNAHALDCVKRAADHIREAVAILLASNIESSDFDVVLATLKPMVKAVEGLVKL